MKILFVDTVLEGHHFSYLNALVSVADTCAALISGNAYFDKPVKIYHYNLCSALDQGAKNINPIKYLAWIRLIRKTAVQEKADIIHFLTGDNLVKYFGLGLDFLKPFKVIITFHHFRYEKMRVISRRKIFNSIEYGIVHTEALEQAAKNERLNNCIRIDYPQFHAVNQRPPKECREFFGIPNDGIPVILAVGNTRFDKGLDILLMALQNLTIPFYLLIAGKEDYFDQIFIQTNSTNYKERVFTYLRYLTDNEMSMALNAANIVVLPYRKIFDGASGPLADAAILGKPIIGPNHGSLGQIIEQNHLGITFESENIQSLSEALYKILTSDFMPNEAANTYKKRLDPTFFQKCYEKVYRSISSDIDLQ